MPNGGVPPNEGDTSPGLLEGAAAENHKAGGGFGADRTQRQREAVRAETAPYASGSAAQNTTQGDKPKGKTQ